jgi:vacuolar-type H+-ATPase subunit H
MGVSSFFKNLFGGAKDSAVTTTTDKAEGFADEAIEKAKDFAEGLVDKAESYVDVAKEKIEAYIPGVGETIDNVVDTIKEKASGAIETAGNYAEELVDTAKEKVTDLAGDTTAPTTEVKPEA